VKRSSLPVYFTDSVLWNVFQILLVVCPKDPNTLAVIFMQVYYFSAENVYCAPCFHCVTAAMLSNVCMVNCWHCVTAAVLPNAEFAAQTTPKRGRKRKNFDEVPPQLTADLAKRRSTRVSGCNCWYNFQHLFETKMWWWTDQRAYLWTNI